MQRLNGADASFVYGETPSSHMYLGTLAALLDGGGLNITAVSYLDHVDFGYVVCPEVVEDPWQLADATAVAFTELEKAAAASTPRASKETARRATDGAGA